MGIFDNATSVVIGNKEVQSIVRVSDGAVLYQKAASHSYALAFSSATYQTDSNGDVTVSVTLTDNGVPVSGESVSFSDGSSVYTGITNNNGVASLNYNCQSNKTLTATYSNASATASIVSNYTPAYTGAMDYTLAQNILIVPTSVATTAQLSMCSITGIPVEWMEGWLLDDTTIPSLNTSVPSSDLWGFISEAEEVPNLYNMGGYPPQILEVSASSFASGVDITQFTTPPDYFNYDYAQGLLYIIFIDSQGRIHKVDYSATDSTHLTITITNDIISE